MNDDQEKLPAPDESDWIEFASLPVVSGRLRVSDPMFYRDLPHPPTFDVEPDTYRIMVKTLTFPESVHRRVSRLRAILREPSSLGPVLDEVIVDFAQVGVFDPVVLEASADRMDDAERQEIVEKLCAVKEFGIVRYGPDERAIMPIASSGFGDGGYPIHELLHDGKRVGVEVVFIGPELPAD